MNCRVVVGKQIEKHGMLTEGEASGDFLMDDENPIPRSIVPAQP